MMRRHVRTERGGVSKENLQKFSLFTAIISPSVLSELSSFFYGKKLPFLYIISFFVFFIQKLPSFSENLLVISSYLRKFDTKYPFP